MTSAARPLASFPLLRTQDAEEMCAALGRVYAKPTISLGRLANKVDVVVNRYQAADIALAYTKYGAPLAAAYPENDFAMQTFPIRGCGQISINKVACPLDPRHGAIASPGLNYTIKVDGDYEHFVLVIRGCALADKLQALTGATVKCPPRFNPAPDISSPPARALFDHFLFLVDKLNASTVPLQKFVLAEFEQTLLVMFLHANRHNFSHLLERAPPGAAPRQVRCVEEYIEANWQRAITLEDLANISGVSACALFRSFRSSRGYSPMEFASMVRLGHARELLRRPDSHTTVAAVASACGFADLGRFEHDYMAAFGEEPSQTLGCAKGANSAGH